MTDVPVTRPRPDRPRGGRAGVVALTGALERTGRPGERRASGETGAVTAEFAVLLPAIVVLLVAILGAGAASVQQVRNQDAAAAAARILARGDAPSLAEEAVDRIAGGGARFESDDDDGWVRVRVAHPGPAVLAELELAAEAAAPVQRPGVAPWEAS